MHIIQEFFDLLIRELSDEQIKEFLDNMQGSLDAYDLVDGMPDYLPPVLYPRTSGSRPSDEENPLKRIFFV